MIVSLRVEKDLKIAKDSSDSHPARKRTGVGFLLGFNDVASNEVG